MQRTKIDYLRMKNVGRGATKPISDGGIATDKISEKNRRYYEENKDEIKEQVRQYRDNNPEWNAERHRRRRAREQGADGILSDEDWEILVDACKGYCPYCGSYEGDNLTLDHIIPLSRGGDHHIFNVVPCCASCNASKGSKLLSEWREDICLMPKLRIGVDLGMTIAVNQQEGGGMSDWLKPAIHAELDFDEVPDEQELREKWDWLWEAQVQPQGDQLLDLLVRELSKRGVSAKTKPKGETY